MIWTILRKLFNFLSSLELAIFEILALSFVLAWGTIVESRHGLFIAQETIYRSYWNKGLLFMLLLSVTAVAVSRLPWKRHHTGFLITHLGIIVLLLGSFLTQSAGVDGVLALGIGESSRQIKMDQNYLNIFRAESGKNYELMLSERLYWNILRPLTKTAEWTLANQEKVQVHHYYPKAQRFVSLVSLAPGAGLPGLRFTLKGSRATMSDMLFLQGPGATTRDLGPARISLQKEIPTPTPVEKPTLYVVVQGQALPKLFVAMPKEKGKLHNLPAVSIGKPLSLGWMDFAFILDEYSASAMPKATYQELTADKAPPFGVTPVEAVEISLGDQHEWLELGASAQIARADAVYYAQYVKRTVDLGLEIKLKDFRVGYYPGTTRPMSYSSIVNAGADDVVISMNEPLHQGGFTFYQSSYESDDQGKPVLSILSVNRDPGRWIKYSGALMIVFGILSMFYFKPMYSGKNKWLLSNKNKAENA